MRYFVLLAVFCLLPGAAQADELGLTKADCAALVEAVPAPDVAYKPGVDVKGKPVLEADITPGVVTPPETYSFTLTVDAARKLGLAPDTEGKMAIGTVTIGKDGQVSFNGKPMEGAAEAALKAACAPK